MGILGKNKKNKKSTQIAKSEETENPGVASRVDINPDFTSEEFKKAVVKTIDNNNYLSNEDIDFKYKEEIVKRYYQVDSVWRAYLTVKMGDSLFPFDMPVNQKVDQLENAVGNIIRRIEQTDEETKKAALQDVVTNINTIPFADTIRSLQEQIDELKKKLEDKENKEGK